MARGGWRAGAGRPTGAQSVKTIEVAKRLAHDGGVTPLEVMIQNMRYYYEEAGTAFKKFETFEIPKGLTRQKKAQAQKEMYDMLMHAFNLRGRSQECAVDAAPYMHAKLAAIEVNQTEEKQIIIQFVGADRDL